MILTINSAMMHTNASEADRLVWLVIAPSGRVLAERMTRQGAERFAARYEG